MATVPAAHESEGLTVFSEHRIIDNPSPLPTALGRGTLGLGMAPDAQQNLEPQSPEAFEPGAFGQGTEEFARDVFVPAPHPGEFMRMPGAKESGKHEAHDFAQQGLLRLQTAFNLGDQGIGEA